MLLIVIHIVVVVCDFIIIHVQHGGLGLVVGEDLHLLAVRDKIIVDPFKKRNLCR